jgi:alpha-galactosidase
VTRFRALAVAVVCLDLALAISPAPAQTANALAPAGLPPSLTPPSPAKPEIHGARIIGTQSGHPFLYTIAATGERPMTFSADHLPTGLKLDAVTGQITGTMPNPAVPAGMDDGLSDWSVVIEAQVTLHAHNALGDASRPLKIVAGVGLALTPPMGWNSWNCFGGSVTQAKVEAAADAMVSSGLAEHGWTYINVDDVWQMNRASKDPTLQGAPRDAAGNIVSNHRFPDMKAMAEHIHQLGLRAGLYSSPGPWTCGGCAGSYQHEAQDAQQYAAWGFDYLKYDWCSYDKIYRAEGPPGLAGLQKPYKIMGDALAASGRDIVFSFCQYGMGEVWKWGAKVDGNSWRTTGDIRDSWDSMTKNGARGVGLSSYAGPGHWNDPDMLVVGDVGWGAQQHPSRLTADEQYFHISLWALQGAPLLLGCDLTKLDPFTLGLLTNDEVIDVDQDPLGKVADLLAKTIDHNDPIEAWARPLEDGSRAVGLFNKSNIPAQGSVTWADLKISGPHRVRDLWRQKDLGVFTGKFSTTVPGHGVVLVRVSKG